MSYLLDKNHINFSFLWWKRIQLSVSCFTEYDELHPSSKYFWGQSTTFQDWSQRLYARFFITTNSLFLIQWLHLPFVPVCFLLSFVSNLAALLFLEKFRPGSFFIDHFSFFLSFTLSIRRHFPKGILTPVPPDLHSSYYP